MSLEGKVAIVSGAAQGLGAAIAMALAAVGARVAALDIGGDISSLESLGTRELLEVVAAEITGRGTVRGSWSLPMSGHQPRSARRFAT